MQRPQTEAQPLFMNTKQITQPKIPKTPKINWDIFCSELVGRWPKKLKNIEKSKCQVSAERRVEKEEEANGNGTSQPSVFGHAWIQIAVAAPLWLIFLFFFYFFSHQVVLWSVLATGVWLSSALQKFYNQNVPWEKQQKRIFQIFCFSWDFIFPETVLILVSRMFPPYILASSGNVGSFWE